MQFVPLKTKNLLTKPMPMKKFLLLCFSFVFAAAGLMAQDRSISGKVTAQEDGAPLPGVNVVVKGTTNGAVTDIDGNYKLNVSSGETLVFSFIGYISQEVEIGERTIIDLGLAADVTQLAEVIVTGQGIQRDRKAIGYALSQVNSNQIAARPVNDVGRILQGKIPGVSINPNGGTSGAGSSINIRGYSTLTGSSQPLWVVDGVPFNSATNSGSGFTTGGAAVATSRFLDIDPNNIENITVLKGLAATVLYGDQGRNGVILVTTKGGNSKKAESEISIQQSMSYTEIASLPDFQDNYGNGFQGLYGAFFSNWGPNFAEIDSVGHPYQFLSDAGLRSAFPQYYFNRYDYEAKPDVGGFFRKGLVSNTSLNVSGGTAKLGYNTAVSYTNEEGFTPGNDLKRINISSGFNAAVNDKITVKYSLQLANTDVVSPPLNGATGGGGAFSGIPSLFANMLYTPRSVDVLNWPYETPTDKRSIFFRGGNDIPNPLWMYRNFRETSTTNRFFNAANISYDFNEALSLMYRVGFDFSNETQIREYNKGANIGANINQGILQTRSINQSIWNHDLIFSFNKQITSDIKVFARAGANARNDFSKTDGVYSEGQVVYGLMRHSNFSSASSRSVAFSGSSLYGTGEQQRYGVYADVSTDYKGWAILNLAGRKDWVSNLENGNNSLFYPSASVAFIPTDAFSGLKSNVLRYLKFRAGYGTSAGYGSIYSTRSTVGQNLRSFADVSGTIYGSHSIGDLLGNAKLKPELQQEIEAGFETKLFNDRFGIDFTVYNRSTRDLITAAPIDRATGYSVTLLNLGRISNKGMEIGVNGQIIKAGDFSWDVIWNFNLVRPFVEELGLGVEQVVLSGFTNLGNFAVPGKPYNLIKGTNSLKSPTGERVVGSDGNYFLDPIIEELGNPNPNYTTSLINTINWKGFSLNFQFDYRDGGIMSANTVSALLGRGVTVDTDFNRDLTFILPGVVQTGVDGSGNPVYKKNDVQLSASDYGFTTQFFGNSQTAIFDATTIRLREISLGYQFPKALMSKTPFKSGFIQVNGNNLWFNAVNTLKGMNFDPEVSSLGVGNGLGFDFITGPSAKRYGVVLKLTF